MELRIRQITNTYLLDIPDYTCPIKDIVEKIVTKIKSDFDKWKIIVVAHSYGSFFALEISKQLKLHALVLLDPTIRTEKYSKYLKETNRDEEKLFLNISESIPLPNKTIVKVYLAFKKCDEESLNDLGKRLEFFEKITKNNILSDIIVCPNTSHMLHYNQPDKFVLLIKELLKN